MLDREAESRTYGLCDRDFWAWKFRDFPLTMLQAAMLPIAQLWRLRFVDNPYCGSERVREWIAAALRATCARQRRNGAFESVGPNAIDHGVTLAVVHLMARTVALLGAAVEPDLRERVQETVQRACRFAADSDEDYAFISNHQALFALAWLDAAELLNERAYRTRADSVLAEIHRHQSSDGWFAEYGGPDPGYETLGIWYLSQVWQRTHDSALLEALRRSITFLQFACHPDRSFGGSYGSRTTCLYYPGGLEALGGSIPEAGALARFLRPGLRVGLTVTPASSDAENLPLLVSSYLDASLVAQSEVPGPPVPCEGWSGVRTFAGCGLTVVGRARYYAVSSGARVGVLRVFGRGAFSSLLFEEAGFVASLGRQRVTSQAAGLGRVMKSSNETVVIEGPFATISQIAPTPTMFVLLRLLNLTVFRLAPVARWIRRRVIRRLITGARPTSVTLRRTVTFAEDVIRVNDEVLGDRSKLGDLHSVRSFTPIHMGSAKYFTRNELTPTPPRPLPREPLWSCTFELALASEGGLAIREVGGSGHP